MTRMIVTPVRSSPAIIARSIGAAPRQRGIREGWTFSIRCSESKGSLISWPKAQTATASGRAAPSASTDSGSLTSRVWCTLEAELARPSPPPGAGPACARVLAGVGRGHDQRRAVRRWRRARRSTVGGELRGAEVGGPQAGTEARVILAVIGLVIARRRVGAALAQGPQGAAPVLPGRPVEHQHPVEMVDLVLEHPSLQARGLDQQPVAGLIDAADPDVERAFDVDDHPGEAEAALLRAGQILSRRPLDLGVDERGGGPRPAPA